MRSPHNCPISQPAAPTKQHQHHTLGHCPRGPAAPTQGHSLGLESPPWDTKRGHGGGTWKSRLSGSYARLMGGWRLCDGTCRSTLEHPEGQETAVPKDNVRPNSGQRLCGAVAAGGSWDQHSSSAPLLRAALVSPQEGGPAGVGRGWGGWQAGRPTEGPEPFPPWSVFLNCFCLGLGKTHFSRNFCTATWCGSQSRAGSGVVGALVRLGGLRASTL